MKQLFKKNILMPSFIILTGLFFLMVSIGWLSLNKLWPIIIILLGCILYISNRIQGKVDNNKSKSLDKHTAKLINSDIKEIKKELFGDVKKELIRFLKNQGIILSIVIGVIGFFGIQAYVDLIFYEEKVESEINKRLLQTYNVRLEKGLDDLELELFKVSDFGRILDSLKEDIEKIDSLSYHINKKFAVFKDSIELAKRELIKNLELTAQRHQNIVEFVEKTTEELQKISKEKSIIEKAIDEFRKKSNAIDIEQQIIKENLRYTVNIHFSINKEDKALTYKAILDTLGFNVIYEALSAVNASVFAHFSGAVTYNGDEKLGNKIQQLLEIKEFKNFKIERNNRQKISNNSFTMWIIK